MGLLDFFKKKSNEHKIAKYINGHYPWYSQFGNNIFASDVVQICISTLVNELIKLDMVHVRTNKNNEDVPVNGNIQRVLNNPNPLMTSVDYKSKMYWNLFLNYNAFAYPIYEGDNLKAIYPLQPTSVEWQQDQSGNFYVHFRFGSGYEVTLPYDSVIHMRYKYSQSEFMGGNVGGQPDNKALLETLELNNVLLKGLAKSLKMQMSVNAAIKMRTMVNMDAQLQEIKNFEAKLQNNESGILPLDNQSELIPINKQIQFLDPTTLEFIDKKICRWFGVSIPIIDRNYTPEQYEAFHQSTLEPVIKISSESHTKAIFSIKANSGFGNKIMFYDKELIFMNMTQKINFINILVDTSSAYKNEIRTMAGMRPLAELEGQIAESSNKTNAENNKVGADIAEPTDSVDVTEEQEEEIKEDVEQVVKKPLLVGQIQALTQIIADYQAGKYTYNQALQMLIIGVGLSQEEAEKLLDKQAVKEGGNEDE